MAGVKLEGKGDFSLLWGDTQLADVTIQIKLKPKPGEQQQQDDGTKEDPPAKRARTDEAGEAGEAAKPSADAAAAAPAAADVAATMRAHSHVLVQRSAYFRAILMGGGAGMVEGRTRVITVELEDEQEVEDFQRLIKLSYMPSYAEEDGLELSKEELLRLLVMADAYEMRWCAVECGAALPPFDTYDEAVTFFKCVPDVYLEDKNLQPAIEAAGDVIAKALGPVEKLWKHGECFDPDEAWQYQYTLDERVKGLPLGAIEAALSSYHLQIKSENEPFSLALWWILEQKGSKQERQRQFNCLLKCMRYAHMSCAYLAMVAQIDWVQRSGLLPAIMARAIWRRELPREDMVGQLPFSRIGHAWQEKYSCMVTTELSKDDIDCMEEQGGDRLDYVLGLVQGFPCYLSLIREEGNKYSLAVQAELDFTGPGKVDLALKPRVQTRWLGSSERFGDNDKQRGFAFRVTGGTVGRTDAENLVIKDPGYGRSKPKTCWTRVGFYDPFMKFSAAFLKQQYDEQGTIKVALELEIDQPRSTVERDW